MPKRVALNSAIGKPLVWINYSQISTKIELEGEPDGNSNSIQKLYRL